MCQKKSGQGHGAMELTHSASIIVLCGLPGAGKTTLSKHLQAQSNKFAAQVSLIEYDHIESGLAANTQKEVVWSHEIWQQARLEALNKVKRCLVDEGSVAGDIRRIIVVDDNMYYRSMRKQFYKLARDSKPLLLAMTNLQQDQRETVRYRFPESNLINLGHRERPVSEAVIIGMGKKIEVPNPGNEFEEHTLVLHDPEDLSLTELVDLLNVPLPDIEALQTRKERCRAENLNNFIHQLDNALRAAVTQKTKSFRTSYPQKDVKDHTRQLQEVKKELLKNARKQISEKSLEFDLEVAVDTIVNEFLNQELK